MHKLAMGLVMGALAVSGAVLPAGPTQAEILTHTGWTHREDARPPATAATWSRTDLTLDYLAFDELSPVVVRSEASDGGPTSLEFIPPAGEALEVGRTYTVGGLFRRPTGSFGQVVALRGGTMCGLTEEQLYPYRSSSMVPTAGWFRIDRLDIEGNYVRSFAATYEISCQFVDGPAGFEGSVAVDTQEPQAAVPPAPVPPGPVTDLEAVNVLPAMPDINRTTLSWTNPAGYGDITVDGLGTIDPTRLPAAIGWVGSMETWRGDSTSWSEDYLDGYLVRSYRVTPRGPTGRLGTPTHLTVRGSRLETPITSRGIQIGQRVFFKGQLTEALGMFRAPGEIGPPIAGRRLVMCRHPRDGSTPLRCDEVDSAVTDEDGRFTVSAEPVANSYYTVRLPVTDTRLGNCSVVLATGVAPQTDLRPPTGDLLRARGSYVQVRKGTVVRFTTSRARRGSLGFVRLQRRLADGSWRTLVRKDLGSGTDRLRLPYRVTTRGVMTFRVVKPADRSHVTGRSRIVRIRVQ